jgi:hypothetical protein
MSTLNRKPPVAQAAARNNIPRQTEQGVRAELALLQARYDGGVVPQAVFSVIRSLEVELAWIEHRGQG